VGFLHTVKRWHRARPGRPRVAPTTGNPLFTLQPLEPRLLLSADPITGLFDDSLTPDLLSADDSADSAVELGKALDDLVQVKGSASDIVFKPVSTSGFLVSTADDVEDYSGGGGEGSSDWTAEDLVSATGVTFEPAGSSDGRFDIQFDVSQFSSSSAGIDALHYVSADTFVGGFIDGTQLLAGDLLFSTNGTYVFDGSDGESLTVQRSDIAVFRPDTVGDYSSGSFFTLFDMLPGDNSSDITALTLVEQTTTIAGDTAYAGDLIIVVDNGSYDEAIQLVSTSSFLGFSTTTTFSDLVADGGSDIETSDITGIDLVETNQSIGGVTVSAGTLLLALDGQESVVGIKFTGSSTSLEYGDGTVTTLWDMDTLGLEGNSLDALTLATVTINENVSPTGSVTLSGSATEDQTLTANTSALADEDGLGSFSYQWLRDGSAISGAAGVSYTLGDADVGHAVSVRVSYTDGYGTLERVTSAATASVANINDAPTGSVTLAGSATEDQTLTANTSALADADGLGSYSYQWLRNGVAISGANGVSYTLGNADVGQQISVSVSYSDGHGTAEAITSAASSPVANVNDVPVGNVDIIGSLTEDVTVRASAAIFDPDGVGAYSYQWLRNGAVISGATAITYTLSDDDVGQSMSVRVSYTDGWGTLEQVTSAASAAIANTNDLPTGTIGVLGTAVSGQILALDLADLDDIDGLGSFSYQWYRDGVAVAGADSQFYLLSDADIDAQMTARVSYTDGYGTAEQVVSTASNTVVDNITTDIASVNIAGLTQEYQTLLAEPVLTDINGNALSPQNLRYQWFRDGVAVADATAQSYTLSADDIGSRLQVFVTLDNPSNDELSALSIATATVTNTNDAPVGLPQISGVSTEDETLTVTTGNISDADGVGDFSYQWLRDGEAINGATGANYTLGDADVGTRISVMVNYLDGFGTAESITSAATARVSTVNDAPTGSVIVAGSAREDLTLRAVTTALRDVDGLGELNYQWLRDGAIIAGATAQTYSLGDDDVGRQISVRVSYTDGQGNSEQLVSSATTPVVNSNDAPTGSVGVTGNAVEDARLSANTLALADADGLGVFSYQWLRDGETIAGANGVGYNLSDADVGAHLSVTVTYTDGQGTLESVTSAATAAVENINDAPDGLPAIIGSAEQFQTLRATTQNLADADGLGEYSYQWLRNGQVIEGASERSYTLAQEDVGSQFSVRVSYSDGYGVLETVISGATAAVANVNDAPLGSVTLRGVQLVGEVLTANTDNISDSDGLGQFHYQWYRDGVAIEGATGASYRLVDEDAAANVSVQVSYSDAFGYQEQLQSAAILVLGGVAVEPHNPAATTNTPSSAGDNAEPTEGAPADEPEADNSAEQAPENNADAGEETTIAVTAGATLTDLPTVDQATDFTQQNFSGFSTQLGDSSSLRDSQDTVNLDLLRHDSLLAEATDGWFQADDLTNLDNFLDPLILVNNLAMNDSLDQLREQFIDHNGRDQILWTGSATLTASFSVGYVVWLARSGILLSTALGAMPMWRFIDPLPVLMSAPTAADNDDESLESMVADTNAANEPNQDPQEQA